MITIRVIRDKDGKQVHIETSLKGKSLLTIPQLNKGSAFSNEERWEFGLEGKLPFSIETIEQQQERAHQQYDRFHTDLERHIYLRNLHGTNETLFYKLVQDNLDEMLPIVYTPTVGEAVKKYSLEFRKPRGLYICYEDRHRIPEILKNRTNQDVKLIVASDAEGVLGIGDQGVGGMEIPVAKLMVYTLCAGINPNNYLPVFLDTGTNNQQLLDDPLYLGWRHNRIRGDKYDEMMYLFVEAVKDEMPGAFLHWEDFGRANARKNLERFKDDLCSFNDDMQGTAVVTVAALLAAVAASKVPLLEQRIIIFGAGTAGVGIADQIVSSLVRAGMSEAQARKCFWLLDRPGLLHSGLDNAAELPKFQQPYLRDNAEVKDWNKNPDGVIGLYEVVKHVKPTILIGCSTVAGAFDEQVVTQMAEGVERPIIFPLSNPTSLIEAVPSDLLKWTAGKALVATGSPFAPVVDKQGQARVIAQCNNALAFPGIGLGVLACKAKKLTADMLWKACEVLSKSAPVHQDPSAPVLPPLGAAYEISLKVAAAVARQGIDEGVADDLSDQQIQKQIELLQWEPKYYPYHLIKK